MGGTTKWKKLDMRTKLRSKITLFFMTLGMLLAVPAVAFAADQLLSDVIEASAGPQPVRNLGTVNPGATLTPNVNFSVLCNGAAGHFNSDDSVTLNFNSATSSVSPAAAGATVSATNTTVRGPSAWAADSDPCGTFSTAQAQGSSVATIKAPSTPGTYTYTVNYNLVRSGADPNEIGGAVNPAQFVLTVAQTDSTAPVISKVVTGTLGTNGWYKSNVSVDWTVSDPESAISSQNGCADFSVTSDQHATTYTCTATSAGGTSSDSVTIKRDATGPGVVASPDRNADHNGWYNHAVTVSFSGNDATSGMANCDPPANFNGPDGTGKSVSGVCTDNAGNSASATFGPFNYDDTKPSVTADPDRGPDHNGWYNHAVTFSFSGTDATSSVESCSPDKVYDQPDGTNITVNGTCTDKAGNTSDPGVSTAFDYDATAPTSVTGALNRLADHNGWYNHAVGYQFTGQDTTSHIDSCSSGTYSGPDGAGLTINGTCTDKAGNESALASTAAFDYDATAPTNVSGAPARNPDHNGWYNSPVGITFTGQDAMSDIDSCSTVPYNGPDGTGLTVNGTCTDSAGNESTPVSSSTYKYDSTAPNVTANPDRLADNNGWYNHAVTVSFSGNDATSGMANCDPAVTYGDDNTEAGIANKSLSGECTDNAGNSGQGAFTFDYDAHEPIITSLGATTAPNGAGWYKNAIDNTFKAADGVSGFSGHADPYTFTKPSGAQEGNAVTIASGPVSDVAGNTNQGIDSAPYKIDLSDPTNIAFVGGPSDGASYDFGNVPAHPTCTAQDSVSGLKSCAVTGYSNAVGNHTLTATATDNAGRTATKTLSYTVLAWKLSGFYQPVDMNDVVNTVKNGSTVPLKFEVFQASGPELTDTAIVKQPLTAKQVSCGAFNGDPLDEIELLATGSTTLRYDSAGGQFIYNWQTPKGASQVGKCYTVSVGTQDGSSIPVASFKLK